MRAPHSRGRQRMVPLCSAGRTAFRGCEPPQRCQPQHDRPLRGSNKSARAATIFIHNGAPQALIGCFEAGPTGYALSPDQGAWPRLSGGRAGPDPKRSGERIKTNRRDAVTLARLHRAGELTGVWAPNAAHEAVRDLVRAREAAGDDLRRKRQQLLSFLLRHGRIYSGGGHWTLAHRRWLAGQKFDHAAQQIVFQEAIDAIEDALQRLRRLEKQLALIVPDWSMAPVVEAYQAMRGASFLVAVTFAAEIGDVRRFDTPRQLMSFLGLVPAERSTGDTIRRKGLTLAGNRRARRAGRGGLDLSLSRQSERDLESPARGAAEGRARHRLEGAGSPVRSVSAAQRHGQETACRRGGDRPRDGRLPVGHRTGGRARLEGTVSPFRCPEPSGARRWGTPSLVMWPGLRPTPSSRPRKAPRRRHGRR